MTRVYKIMIFLLLLVILTSEDCSERGSVSQHIESHRANMFLELEQNFVAEELEAEKLEALEKRAVQKLHDLVDYLNIYADSSLNIQFRQQTRQVIADAFQSADELQKFFKQLNYYEDTTNQLLLSVEEKKILVRLGSVIITKTFQKTSTSVYIGEISYNLYNQEYVSEGRLKIVAQKVTKHFGEDSLNVWELFIRINDD